MTPLGSGWQFKWWKVGFIRILAITIIGIAIRGISYNIDRHTLWDFSRFSGPTAIIALIIGVAIFILGFRTERDHATISGRSDS